jgi:hypothetical protein
VILEGDALAVVQALCRPDDDASRYGIIIEDARRILKTFQVGDVRHVRRDGNKVAHNLAKVAVLR